RAVVLGAGGAARAVVYALLAAHAQVIIANRTVAHARRLGDQLGALFGARVFVLPLTTDLAPLLASADLLVNTTSVGMARPGDPRPVADPLPFGLALRRGITVNDLVYAPRETALLCRARAAGARTVDGLGMLVHQGAAAFELWTGQKAPVEIMRVAAASGDCP
ncbi:MAG TPA: shikimate dehydrogenase, partial [Chloroflexi bacterium]|nr:shikimate dehydrogenase [Chloroflexota bacterium]